MPRQNAEKISKTNEEAIYGDIHHINHSLYKNVPNIQFKTWPRSWIVLFINVSYYYQYIFTAYDVQKSAHTIIHMLIHSSLSMLTIVLPTCSPTFAKLSAPQKRFSKPVLNYKHLLLTHLLPDIYSDQLNKTMFSYTSEADTSSECT